jgi:PAP2 superfamily
MLHNFRLACFCLALILGCGQAQAAALSQEQVLQQWYELVLKLVRHTATYSPPLASRNFAYLGVTSYEAVASGDKKLKSLAGQLHGLKELPQRDAGKTYDEAIVLNAALGRSLQLFFSNTGPSGQNALRANLKMLNSKASLGVAKHVTRRSNAYGEKLADHIYAWSLSDGGARIKNMGFPLEYSLKQGKNQWVPTNQLGLQQVPLLPEWGKNRPFAMPADLPCKLPPPPPYSEDKTSEFYRQAMEVKDVRANLTDDQIAIAKFWSDDPMLSVTPPGHWISILLQLSQREHLPASKTAEGLARLGVATADAFIGCWHSKYEYNLLRPVTYIRKVMDPKWEPLLITPPFPEYPSGHSVQSGAAAEVLEKMIGSNTPFDDATYVADGIPARKYPNFKAAAEEAAKSRLYGGIHFNAAIVDGLVQGKCIGTFAANLQTVQP